jgi:TonB family protein
VENTRSDRRIRGGLVVCAVAILALASPGWQPAGAQGGAGGRAGQGAPPADTTERGDIVGTVRDSAGRPVSGARVEGGPHFLATTDSAGTFALRGLPVGPVVLTVRRIGFSPLVTQWDVGSIPLTLDLRLRAFPTVLPAVHIQSRREPFDARLEGFYQRESEKLGYYLTEHDLQQITSFRLTDALRRIPGVRLYTMPGALGTGVRFVGTRCPALIFVDGFPASLGRFDLNMVDLSMVEGIEAYPTSTSVPIALSAPYGQDACGVIAIWSKPMRPLVRAGQQPSEAKVNLDSLMAANEVYTPETVDEAVRYVAGSGDPSYPDSLYRARVPGKVVARFVVDTTGAVEPGTVHMVSSTAPAFEDAVRQALGRARFTPAKVAGRVVRELVEMPFEFTPVDTSSASRKL